MKIWKIASNIVQFDPLLQEEESVRQLVNAINIHNWKQEQWLEKNLSSLEEASVAEAENYEFQIFHNEEDSEYNEDEANEHTPPSQSNNDPMPLQPPTKRPRIRSGNRKIYCVKWVQKSLILVKKMGSVSQVQ